MKESMLQKVMTAPRELRFDRVPVPEAKLGQVLLKIKIIMDVNPEDKDENKC